MTERCVTALCSHQMYSFFNKIDIQQITERSEANTEIRYFWPTILVISGKGRPQEKRISKFLNIHKKKIVFYPNQKIFAEVYWVKC